MLPNLPLSSSEYGVDPVSRCKGDLGLLGRLRVGGVRVGVSGRVGDGRGTSRDHTPQRPAAAASTNSFTATAIATATAITTATAIATATATASTLTMMR